MPNIILHKKRFLRLTILTISILFASGCSLLFPDPPEQLAAELASTGIDEYRNGHYRKSIEHFEKLKDWYPFDKYTILAELKIADAHFHLKEYDEAIFAYENFEQLHPKNEAIPYVIHQIALCYFERIDTVDRDQSHAQKAASVFKRLIYQYPDNRYARQARQNLKTCYKSIAEHELYVGMFYYKARHYKAALNRFNAIIANYPDVGSHRKALKYITRCEIFLADAESEKSN